MADVAGDARNRVDRAAGFKRGTSSVMLVGRGARVLFSSEGPLSAAQRARLIALLRSDVDADEGS